MSHRVVRLSDFTNTRFRTDLVFGIVGSAFMDALDIFEPAGIRFVSVQHEQNAVHMADGYSRVTNKPGKPFFLISSF